MSETEKQLSSVLKLDESGEIKPRSNWRVSFEDCFTAQPPKLSYLRYESWCKEQGKNPELAEWLLLAGIDKAGVAP